MDKETEKITQRQQFNDELKRLAVDVTAKDRIEAMRLGNVGYITISSYLNGRGRNNDTAANLIRIFKQLIEQRNQVAA